MLLLSAAACHVAAEEPKLDPKEAIIEVQFFFSKKDPKLDEVDKVLAGVVKQFPMLRIERISIDDKAGYARLSQLEKSLGISKPGDMTIAFGPYFLLSKGDQRDIELYFGAMMKRLIGQMKGDSSFKDRIAPKVADYAKKVFGKEAVATIEPDQKFNANILYRVAKDGKPAGWIADAYDPIGCPICSSAQLLMATDANLAILDVTPVREIERLGTKIPEKEIEEFIDQFKGKTPAKPPVKVDAVSRATKTTKAFIGSVNEVLEELKKRAVK